MSKLKESKKEKQERLEIQRIQIQRVFTRFDTDGSGEIDEDEFLEGMKVYFELHETKNPKEFDDIFRAMFKVADKARFMKKRNKQLDIKEFERIVLAFPQNLCALPIHDLIGETLFNFIDTNKSGSISKKEIKEFCQRVNKDKDDQIEMFKHLNFDGVDFNGDGHVSKDEFVLWFWSEVINQ